MDKLTHFLKSTLQRAQSLLAQLSARLRCILLCIKRVFKRLIIRLRRLYRKIRAF